MLVITHSNNHQDLAAPLKLAQLQDNVANNQVKQVPSDQALTKSQMQVTTH